MKRYKIADLRAEPGAFPWVEHLARKTSSPSEHSFVWEGDSPLDALLSAMMVATIEGVEPQRRHMYDVAILMADQESPEEAKARIACSPRTDHPHELHARPALKYVWAEWYKLRGKGDGE